MDSDKDNEATNRTTDSDTDNCGETADAGNEGTGSDFVPVCPKCGNPMSWTGGELNCQVERYYCSHCWF